VKVWTYTAAYAASVSVSFPDTIVSHASVHQSISFPASLPSIVCVILAGYVFTVELKCDKLKRSLFELFNPKKAGKRK
jgi:hypothetical protein